jgi:hypothetical protein
MGWSFLYGGTRQSVIAHVLSDRFHTTIASSVRGNVVWAVKEIPDRADIPETYRRKRFIACFMLSGGGEPGLRWGFKDVDESMGPREVSCPLKFFAMVPEPDSPVARQWRERVRAWHAAQTARRHAHRALRVGDRVSLKPGCSPTHVWLTSVCPLQGTGPDGRIYRLSMKHVDGPSMTLPLGS